MLPILQTTHNDLLRYFRRGELQWARHLGEETELDFGVTISNPALPGVYDANRVLDAFLPPNANPAEIITQAESFFAARHCRLFQWTFNASAEEFSRANLESELVARGYRRQSFDVMRLASPPDVTIGRRADLQIIPARASYKHARQIAEQSALRWNHPPLADATMLHLDDPHWDSIIALQEGIAVGTIGVLAIGEIGLIEDVFIAEPFRRQGIASTLLARAIEICQRSVFRHVLLGVSSDNAPAISLYHKFGFAKVADAPSFISP